VNRENWNPGFLDISPIFGPFKPLQNAISNFSDWPSVEDLDLLKQMADRPIITCSDKSVCFVSQQTTEVDKFTQQYEPRIYLSGEVPTRHHNWHDFFNALVWMTFPQTKAVLNQVHFNELCRELQNNQKQRGSLRDAATLFDESGVVVISSREDLVKLLQKHEWKQLFWEQREAVLSTMRFFVFGHGLYEKALNPYLGMTGKGIILQVDEIYFNQPLSEQIVVADKMLQTFLLQEKFSSVDLTPIPLLGYPTWSSDNCNSVFYNNKQYFRPHPSQR